MDEELLKKAEKECQKIRPPVDSSAHAGDGRFGEWKLEQLLGRNSIGELYLATSTGDKCTNVHAALRTLDSALSRNSRLVKRFLQEAEKAAAIVHPQIARVLDFGRADDGTAFIVREFVTGQTLQTMLNDGPFEFRRAIEILIAICGALEESAKNELLHRNLMPSNIIIDEDGKVHVVDFGLSKAVPAEGRETKGLTDYHGRHDDMRYVSMEQMKDERLDIRSDLYSLGCIMHVLFTGEEVFANIDGYRLLQAKSRGQIDTGPFQNLILSGSEKERRKAIENVTALVRRSISGDKKFRYSSPQELSEDLRRIGQGKDLQRATYDAVKEIEKANGLGVRNDKPGTNRATGGSGADSTSNKGGLRPGFYLSTAILLMTVAAYLFAVNHCFGPQFAGPVAGVAPPASSWSQARQTDREEESYSKFSDDELKQYLPGNWDFTWGAISGQMKITSVYIIDGARYFTGLMSWGGAVRPMVGSISAENDELRSSLLEGPLARSLSRYPILLRADANHTGIIFERSLGHAGFNATKQSAEKKLAAIENYQVSDEIASDLRGCWTATGSAKLLPAKFYLKPLGQSGIVEMRDIDLHAANQCGPNVLGILVTNSFGIIAAASPSYETVDKLVHVNGKLQINKYHISPTYENISPTGEIDGKLVRVDRRLQVNQWPNPIAVKD